MILQLRKKLDQLTHLEFVFFFCSLMKYFNVDTGVK